MTPITKDRIALIKESMQLRQSMWAPHISSAMLLQLCDLATEALEGRELLARAREYIANVEVAIIEDKSLKGRDAEWFVAHCRELLAALPNPPAPEPAS